VAFLSGINSFPPAPRSLPPASSVTGSLAAVPAKIPEIPELPLTLQPGRIVTMQAVDAPHQRQYYINNPDYWGQPKRDGQRLLAIATARMMK